MKLRWSPYLLVLLLGFTIQPAKATNLHVSFNVDKPPFAFLDASGKLSGIEVDIITEVLRRNAHGITPVAASKSRLLNTVKQGEVHIAASVQGKDGQGLFFSDDFVEYRNVAISRKDDRLQLNSLDDLDHHSFVIWQRGWADLGAQFAAKYKPDSKGKFPRNYVQAGTQAEQVRIFFAKRVDVIVIDLTIFKWYQAQSAKDFDGQSESLTYHPIFKSGTGFAVAFTNKALRDRFNLTLQQMRLDGSYQKILAKYQ